MKKEILAFSVLSAAFALVAGDYVSPNVVGRCDVTTVEKAQGASKSKTIIPVPFLDYSADPASEAAIKVGDIIQVGNLAAGDMLYKIDGGIYQAWKLNSNKTAWEKQESVNLGANDGTGDVTLKRGDGFWLETAATSVVLLGQAPATEGVEVTLKKGWNLLGVTKSEDVALGSITGAEKGDMIILSDGSRVVYGATSGWTVRSGTATTSLKAGTGFWYYSNSDKENKSITL